MITQEEWMLLKEHERYNMIAELSTRVYAATQKLTTTAARLQELDDTVYKLREKINIIENRLTQCEEKNG